MTHQQQTAFENIVGKGEIAHYEQFLLFPQCFLFNQILYPIRPYIVSSFAAEFKEPKIGMSCNGLTLYQKKIFRLVLIEIVADDGINVTEKLKTLQTTK